MRNQGDGWAWTLDYLSRVLNSAAVVDPEAQIEDIADALAGYGNFAAAIGRRLAELHAILAAPTDDPDFAPEKATAADAAAWADAVRAQLDAALAALGGARSGRTRRAESRCDARPRKARRLDEASATGKSRRRSR